jgi:alpha-tubulin suppressor-like RCC1 family protein
MFGRNDVGQLGLGDTTTRLTPVQITGLSVALAVSCGFFHTAVLLVDGTVRTFGSGGSGRLGLGDAISRQTPVQVTGITSASAVACGAYHTSVLLSNGTVRVFGNNANGQLGLGDSTSRLTPVQVSGISSSAVAVSGGKYHTAILLADGTVRTFGFNTSGQLGVNDTTSRQTPVQVTGITSASVLACGNYHTGVLLRDGTVRTFGSGGSGRLGVNDTTNRSTAVQVFGISSSATALGCGHYHTAVLLADGSVRTFGQNTSSQLGTGDTASRLTPVQVATVMTVSPGLMAGGNGHTAVVLADGTVRTFGRNDFGQLGVNDTTSRQTPVQVFGISSSATAVACGYGHTAVLLADGTVRTFGNNTYGALGVNDTTQRNTPVTVQNISTATAVSCGTYHTAVLLADGTVRTFGRNIYAALGTNDTTNRLTPVQVFGISSSATAIACGGYFTAVVLADGTVRTFGRNNGGQLGINSGDQSRLTPVQVFGISSSATAVSCGANNTAVLLADGTVRTFGFNTSGQLGVNDFTDRYTPVTVLNITSATAVAYGNGGSYAIVLLADGTVRTFGFNNTGQLGVNDTTDRQTPVQVFGISSSATAVAGGGNHAVVLLADGTVRTFGQNAQGALGINNTVSRLTPVESITLPARTLAGSVGCGSSHTAVVLKDGTVRTFGRNQFGQLGVGDTTSRLMPVQVSGLSTATAVACVSTHTIVLLTDGTVRAFGENTNGQLGVNDTTSRLTPVTVLNITSATAVACGVAHTAVLLGNNTVMTFGSGGNGRLGVGDTNQRNTPVQVLSITSATAVACGGYHTVVLLADGTVRTFGNGAQGQLGINVAGGSRLTPVQVWGISSSAVAVAGGQSHTVVLLADGTVRTFGLNFRGELGDNTTTQRNVPVQVWGISSSAVAIAAGVPNSAYFTAVILADGTVRTFGKNNNGQLGINESGASSSRLTPVQVFGISSSATVVACGAYHVAVILADGTVRTFGVNDQGQLGINNTTDRSTPVQVVAISATVSVTPAPTAFLTSAATSITLAASGGQIWTSSATGVARTLVGSIAGGQYHTAVVLKDGTVRTFGRNDSGQLGVNDQTQRLTPFQVFGISSSATAVACGQYHTAVLLADGTVRTFGRNNFGGLGVNDTTSRQTPVQVFGISSSAVAVACGNYHTAVLLADGTVRTFGYNIVGQLGVNDQTNRSTPVQVFGISSSATAIACGSFHTLVLLADGTVRSFGQGVSGQLGNNDSTTTRQTPVQVFGISSSATAIACGRVHSVVILADGTVRTFGSNGNGQLGINVSGGSRQTPVQVFGISSSATAVACGKYHTTVLLADGTVRTFGAGGEGRLGVNDTATRQTPVQVFGISSSATAVACGFYHTAILLANGTVQTFGNNSSGQLGTNDGTPRSTPVPVFGILGTFPYPTYVTAKGLSLGLSAPTFQLDLSTDKARKLSTTTWTTGSDRRIKSDIQSANLARCVDIVDSLDLKYFKWDIPGVQGVNPTDSHSLGWIAQDVKEFFPNSVRQTQDYGFDDFHNLDSDQLIKTMYGALKKMCGDTYGQ